MAVNAHIQDESARESPSQDHSDRFPEDARFRRWNFQIFSRPIRGESLWVRRHGGRIRTQSEVREWIAKKLSMVSA